MTLTQSLNGVSNRLSRIEIGIEAYKEGDALYLDLDWILNPTLSFRHWKVALTQSLSEILNRLHWSSMTWSRRRSWDRRNNWNWPTILKDLTGTALRERWHTKVLQPKASCFSHLKLYGSEKSSSSNWICCQPTKQPSSQAASQPAAASWLLTRLKVASAFLKQWPDRTGVRCIVTSSCVSLVS